MEFKNSSDYTCIVFFDDSRKEPFKMQFVNGCYAFSNWLDSSDKYRDWKYFNVYARRTGRYLRRMYKGNYIENKPR